jgi:excisionase family DNA binding protein
MNDLKFILSEIYEIKFQLEEVLKNINTSLMTREDVALMLKCSPRTVDNLVKNKRGLLVFKCGDLVRFKKSEVLKFINKHTTNS